MTRTLTAADHDRIAEAVRAAEAETAGEIYCVVARSSDSYFYPAAFFVTLAVMLASLAAALLLEHWWVSMRLPVFWAAVALALATAWLVLSLAPGLRIHFVPRNLRYRRAHDNGLKQFLARNVHITTARTGVLIFVSLAERYAEVVADAGIDAKVPQETWNGIVADLIAHARKDRLADGFVAAIGAVGALLSTHFPRRSDDANELDDHVVEI
ncbi:TPM domain-containing protein [Mesorhizobium sp. ASY16-5R]|uniref:TPM domain-containing protein n=1 Tax=Mesorhizobium sp. ASY16-5R TaxID=3445772 RepID=UPI003F9F4FD2